MSRALVVAQDALGPWKLLVVSADAVVPAVDASFRRPIGLRVTASFKVDFTGLAVDAECLLGGPGDPLGAVAP